MCSPPAVQCSKPVPFSQHHQVSLHQTQPGRIRFASGRVRDKFSLFLSSKVSFGSNLMSFTRGEVVLCISKWYGCVEYQFMLGC